ncbi:MAG: hypothetical protein RLZZ94_1144 [Bacteroidota bacterium]|jgi:hypothetical protein
MQADQIIFPVKVPYSTAPDIIKLKDDFSLTPISDASIGYKRKELEVFFGHLADEIISEELFSCLITITSKYNLPSVSTIRDLALNVEEDIAILSLGKVIAICFCSPSGFVPSQIVGKSFFEIHQPIPDSDLLLKMSDKMGALLSDSTKGPHRRYVWTITANPSYNQHPSLKDKYAPKVIDDLYFRTEVQTTVPLGDHIHALFSVKVSMTPLKEIWNDNEKKNTILASIDSMSDAMLEYKNLKTIKSILNSK